MSELLEKLSSYNLFNHLVPGTLFAVIVDKLTSYSLIMDDIAVGIITYYFYGLVISRIGSLLIEPLAKKIGFVVYADYADFIAACDVDKKLEAISETNNMYRTLASLFICLVAFLAIDWLGQHCPAVAATYPFLAVLGLLVLFLVAWKKQTAYVSKRIKNASS